MFPLPDPYKIIPGRFMAGEYPTTRRRDGAQEDSRLPPVRRSLFIDLTVERESGLLPCESFLSEMAAALEIDVDYVPSPIVDCGVPGRRTVDELLNHIAETLRRDVTLYVHWRGGVDRTSTV